MFLSVFYKGNSIESCFPLKLLFSAHSNFQENGEAL